MRLEELIEKNKVIEYFDKISKIPRDSGKELKIQEFIKSVAEKYGYKYIIDNSDINKNSPNLMVLPKNENKPIVILQSHVDMVCEKNSNSTHDFEKDPIQLDVRNEDGYDMLYAKETSLGADNGIGVAMMLALLESCKYDNIVYFFTACEESDNVGVYRISDEMKSYIKIAKYCVNLDNEEQDSISIGCASFFGLNIKGKVKKESVKLKNYYEINLFGLMGGHSGIQASSGYGNTIKFAFRLYNNLKCFFKLKLCDISTTNNKHNVIPCDASLKIATDESKSAIKNTVRDFIDSLNIELNGGVLDFDINEIPLQYVLTKESKLKIFKYISLLPYGELFSRKYDGISRTMLSANLSEVKLFDDIFTIKYSFRANIKSFQEDLLNTVCNYIKNKDDTIDIEENPIWEARQSDLLKAVRNIYLEYDKDVFSYPSHGWLEVSSIYNINPKIEIVCIGPSIYNTHSVNEHVDIKSIEKVFSKLEKILDYLQK